MPRRRTTPLNQRAEKALVGLQAAMNAEAAIKATFRLLKSVVPCDFVNVCLRNVRKDERQIPYHLIDSRGREFDPALLEVFFRAHPGMPVLMANPGIHFINTREILPPDKILRKSRFYREMMQVIGFRHAVGMFFWDDPPAAPEAIFSILRAEHRPDFGDAEVALFDRLYPHIEAMLRRVRAIEQERTLHREMRSLARQSNRSACVLDWNLKATDASRAARESCARWNLGAANRYLKASFQLPPVVRDACLQLKNEWLASLRRHPVQGKAATCVLFHPDDPDLRVVVSLHRPDGSPTGMPSFLVEFAGRRNSKTISRADRRALLATLTSRERELMGWICEGRSNQEIAALTGRAVGTVKNALHKLFQKWQVHSRGMLVALARGTAGLPDSGAKSGLGGTRTLNQRLKRALLYH